MVWVPSLTCSPWVPFEPGRPINPSRETQKCKLKKPKPPTTKPNELCTHGDTNFSSPELLLVSQRDLIPSRDQAGMELGDAQTLPRLQPPTRQPPKCQTPKCTIHIGQQEACAILGPFNLQKQQLSTQTAEGGGKDGDTPHPATRSHTLTPGPSCPSCPLSPRTPSGPYKGNVSISQAPPAVFGGVCCTHGPSKISTAPVGGGCLHGKLSSPGFIPTRGQSKLGEKLLRCLLWDQRTPPSQLDPAEKHTGRGLSSSLPLSMHGGVLPLGKVALSQDSARSIVYLGAPQARGAATPL